MARKPMRYTDIWPKWKIDKLKFLWSKGESAAAIGRELDVTKNAVVSKAHYLELEKRPSPIRPRDPNEKRDPVEETRKNALAEATPGVPSEKVSTIKGYSTEGSFTYRLKVVGHFKECQWPIGDPLEPDYRVCGAEPTEPGTSYCKKHLKRAYRERKGRTTKKPEDLTFPASERIR